LTAYDRDDGLELTSVSLSADGTWVVYVRGGDHGANVEDSHPVDVEALPIPSPILVWSIPFSGGEPRALGEGAAPAVSPRGDRATFEKDGELWEVPLDGSRPATRIVAVQGRSGDVVWSPDGSRFAFVSNRGSHSFVGVYTDPAAPIRWLAPSTSRDSSPRWSPDGKRIVFVRRPGSGGGPEPILSPLPEVDPSRIGIYGGSYGGYLTALALARDSELFAAGVDMHGVHDFTKPESGAGRAFQAAMAASSDFEKGDRDEAEEVAFRSSPVASIAKWRSPVLLIHGDDDRNVRFSQTVDLVQRLRAASVPCEELVIPDDTHHWMRHENVVTVYNAAAVFFARIFHISESESR
jgi:dipeptidyl aminopeptidase/acylaminoacyl peptidase